MPRRLWWCLGGVAVSYERGTPVWFFQNLATKITTQFGLTRNIKVFVQQFSLPDCERKIDIPGLMLTGRLFFSGC